MRREDFTVDVDAEAPTPQLSIAFDGDPGPLRERLGDEGDEIDVAYRRTPTDEPGVLAVTDRLTGEFVFEASLSAVALRTLVEAVGERDEGDRQYRLHLDPGDGDAQTFEKATLLVYDADGNLDRDASLIPGGVEL